MADTGSEGSGTLDSLRSFVEFGHQALKRPADLVNGAKDTARSVTEVGQTVSRVAEAVGGESSTLGKVRAAFGALGSGGDGETGAEQKQRLIIQEAIDIAAPRQFVFDQWKDPDALETMSRAARQVEADDDGDDDDEDGGETTQWQAKILFSSRTWSAELTDEIPGRRIAWSTSGDVDHTGTVSFHALDDMLTRVQLEMEYHPSGFVEKFGNLFLTVRHRVRKDLRLFKHYIELRSWPESEEAEEFADADGDAEETAGTSTAKKTTAKKSTAKKSTAQKATAGRRGSSKKATSRKRATKKSTGKKATSNRS